MNIKKMMKNTKKEALMSNNISILSDCKILQYNNGYIKKNSIL